MKESVLSLVVLIGHFLGCEAMHPAFNKDSGMKFGQIIMKHFFIILHSYKSSIIIFHSSDTLVGCECNEFVDQKGYGKCETKYNRPPLRGSLVCYVNIPNSCSDFTPPAPGASQIMSAAACKDLRTGMKFKNHMKSSKQKIITFG